MWDIDCDLFVFFFLGVFVCFICVECDVIRVGLGLFFFVGGLNLCDDWSEVFMLFDDLCLLVVEVVCFLLQLLVQDVGCFGYVVFGVLVFGVVDRQVMCDVNWVVGN